MAYSTINMKRAADLTSLVVHATTIGTGIATLFNPLFAIPLGASALLSYKDLRNRTNTKHAIRRNFGLLGEVRYALESVGPELHQYFVEDDESGKPFTRRQREYAYRLAKNEGDVAPFGTLEDIVGTERIVHSMFPKAPEELVPYTLTFGEREGCTPYTIHSPIMISGMSYGALSRSAVKAFARGAKKASVPICTGEGGYPKHHLAEDADIIFQIGTAKYGVRDEYGRLDEQKLQEIARLPQVKMIEIKLSQGAKPGKGGLLPAAKVTETIAQLRGIPAHEDSVSPPRHAECYDAQSTIAFLRRVQDLTGLPVGFKMCLGRYDEFDELVAQMREADVFPDYIALDGAEGGTGAAPQSFLDHVGRSLEDALAYAHAQLQQQGVRGRTRLVAAGKLIDAGSQFKALAKGADAIYTARGVMFAGGCIQALQCDKNTCPVGLTTHDPALERGLDIEEKSERVASYVAGLDKGLNYLLAATGYTSFAQLDAHALSRTEARKQFGHPKLHVIGGAA